MPKVCLVIPCYNEEKRLDKAAFIRFIRSQQEIDLLFSNDGSKDGTLQLIREIAAEEPGRISIHALPANKGKAEAVRQGMLNAFSMNKYEYVGFWDADLATPLEESLQFHVQGTRQNKKLIMGSRMKRLGANVIRKRSRHLFGRVFSTFASLILDLPAYDTQCGAKLFHSGLRSLFNEPFITRWIFDVELLARYRNRFGKVAAMSEILEYPVSSWEEKGGSKIKLTDFLKVPAELLRIRSNYNK